MNITINPEDIEYVIRYQKDIKHKRTGRILRTKYEQIECSNLEEARIEAQTCRDFGDQNVRIYKEYRYSEEIDV